MTGERNALERFVVDNSDLERLEDLLAEFNLFEAIGVVRSEVRHSNFLRFLLDPQSPHGLGDAFLARFLKDSLAGAQPGELGPVEVDVADLSKTEVLREWKQIDILLRNSPANFVVAIENKIGSGEHSDQLRRYRKTLEAEFPDFRLVFLFLTPEGVRPSDEAWQPISYDLVAETLRSINRTFASRLGPDVFTLMNHYLTLLRRYVVTDSDVAQLCREIYAKHRQALDLIFEHRPDSQSRVSDIMNSSILGAEHLGIVPDRMGKSGSCFGLAEWDKEPWQRQGSGWTKSHRILLFEFQNSGKDAWLYLYVGPGPAEIREALYQAFCSPKPRLKGGVDSMTKSFTRVYRKKWFPTDDIENLGDEELSAMLQKKWQSFLDDDLPEIREIVAEFKWPPGAAQGA